MLRGRGTSRLRASFGSVEVSANCIRAGHWGRSALPADGPRPPLLEFRPARTEPGPSGSGLSAANRSARLFYEPPATPVVDRIEVRGADPATNQETGAVEDYEVVRNVLVRQPDDVSELLDAGLTLSQHLQKGDAPPVCERRKSLADQV